MTNLQIGELFEGRFEVEELLGRGGAATVFSASEQESGRRVAIKVFAASALADVTTRARFHRELRALAGLRSPYIVRLLQYGETEDGSGYLVLEHVAGEDLAEVMKREGALAPKVVVHVLTQLLDALQEAHGAGVVHRAIEPSNVRLFAYQGDPYNVKLLDFGVVRSIDPNATALTQSGESIGTLSYMSPEQLRGEPVGPTSDIYGLGLLAAQMLGGSFWGDDVASQIARTRSDFRVDVGDAPDQLARVVRRMCAFDPAARYESARAVRRALQVPQAAAKTAVREVPRPRRVPVAAVVCGSLLVVGLLVWMLGAVEGDAPRRVPSAQARSISVLTSTPPRTVEADVAVAPVPACAVDALPAAGSYNRSEIVGLSPLRWSLYIPETFSPSDASPILALLAPNHMTPAAFSDVSGFERLADEHGFVVLAVGGASEDVVLRTLTYALERERDSLCLPHSPTFLVGHGTGGHRAVQFGCTLDVDAIAVSSARPSGVQSCEDNKPLPIVLFSPLHSPREPIEGGAKCLNSNPKRSLAEYEASWMSRNGCVRPGEQAFAHKGSTCEKFDCALAAFQHCQLNGGHRWPGAPGPVRPFNDDCDGPETDFPIAHVVWEFFAQIPATK